MKKRIISMVTALSFMLSGTVVLAQENSAHEIFNADNGYEITEILDSLTEDEAAELDIDLTEYNKITYRKYIGNEIYEAQPTDTAELKSAFNTAVEKALKTVIVDNYEIGASFNDTGSAKNNNTIFNVILELSISLKSSLFSSKSSLLKE